MCGRTLIVINVRSNFGGRDSIVSAWDLGEILILQSQCTLLNFSLRGLLKVHLLQFSPNFDEILSSVVSWLIFYVGKLKVQDFAHLDPIFILKSVWRQIDCDINE